jgi:hypothetical protein
MARPTVMTPETLDKLRYVFSIGGSKKEAAIYAKISESTLFDYIKDNPEFSEEIEALIQEPILKAKYTIVESLKDVKDAQWYLERKLKSEFSTRNELTGKDGEQLQSNTIVVQEFSKDEADSK